MNSPQRKVFVQGIIGFFIASVKHRVRPDLDFLFSILFPTNVLFQMSILNEVIKKNLQVFAVSMLCHFSL